MNSIMQGNIIRPRKIAVIGSGISGMTAAYYLSKQAAYDLHVFEAGSRAGGHTATIDVKHENEELAIDTGFIVFNDRTYPNFITLLQELGVSSSPAPMSFSVSDAASGIEYAGTSLNTLFAQRRNILSPQFLRMVRDILRFNRDVELHLAKNPELGDHTLGSYLERYCYSKEFIQWYLLPMGAAIWSSDQLVIEAFPLQFFVRFFRNHGLLDLRERPQWYVINGGSRSYIAPLTALYRQRLYLNTPVTAVSRGVWYEGRKQVCVSSVRGMEFFDEVIFACHSDQALRLLADPSLVEHRMLQAIPYMQNEVVLHRDTSLLPRNKRTWSSWNVNISADQHSAPALSYNMNILQGLRSKHTWCATLNQTSRIDPATIFGVYHYDHPLFSQAGLVAQQNCMQLNGKNNTWYCGAWLGNGFHEDGVVSAREVVAGIQAQPADGMLATMVGV